MSTTLLVVQTLNGLQLGVLLFLIAAGLTLVFGVMDFINLAHGVQYMLGAYLAVTFFALTGSFLGGAHPGARRRAPVRAAARIRWCSAISTTAITSTRSSRRSASSCFSITGVKLVWGAAPLSLPIPDLFSGSVRLADGLLYPVWRLVIIGVGAGGRGAALCAGGPHPRSACWCAPGATNAAMVSALGVDIRRLFMIVFGFGAMLAGFAGIMIAPILSVEPGMGDTILILAFVVIVIGGIGSIRGAFLAALLIGLVDTLGRSFSVDILRLVMGPSPARTVGPGDRLDADLSADGGRALCPAGRAVPGEGPLRCAGASLRSIADAQSAHAAPTPRYVLPVGIFLAFALLPLFGAVGGWRAICSASVARVMIFAIAAVALDLLVGYGALISFGHAAFIGLGAYAVGILAAHGIGDALISLPGRARGLGAVRAR